MNVRNRIRLVMVLVMVSAVATASASVSACQQAENGVAPSDAYVTSWVDAGWGGDAAQAAANRHESSRRLGREALSLGENDVLVTGEGGGATLFLPDPSVRAGVHVGGGTTVVIRGAPETGALLPRVVHLEAGSVSVVRNVGLGPWLVASAGSGDHAGYAVINAGELILRASDEGVSFAVASGRAYAYRGDWQVAPAVVWQNATSDTPPEGGVVIEAGRSWSPGQQAPAAAPESVTTAASDSLSRTALAFGSARSSVWVARAEAGDFTPYQPSVLAGGPSPLPSGPAFVEFKLTQRAPAGILLPRRFVALNVVGGAPSSPVLGLIETRNPASGVIGIRFQRSTIIGINSGISGNTNTDSRFLLRLFGQ